MVRGDVVAEKIGKASGDDGGERGIIEVAADEGTERGEETIGQRTAIDTVEDVGGGQVEFRIKISGYFFRQLTAKQRTKEMATKYRATTLVAKDVTEGRSIADDYIPIIKTRISASS